ncbi:MAG: hypothetical protein Q7J16_07660 [Candidatus Cloacimonadales bacterium]|nr:hypothetical protein [Candidatus Cloacimonadales bacterium]
MRIILVVIIAFCLILSIVKRRKAIVLVLAVVSVPFLISIIKTALQNKSNPITVGNGIITSILLLALFIGILRIRKRR